MAYKMHKVSKHQQKHKGYKIVKPRIAITGGILERNGFNIGDQFKVIEKPNGDLLLKTPNPKEVEDEG